MKYGVFINPSPKSLSDLINDNNYMSIREYILDVTSLKGNSAIAISDLNAGSSIVRVSLNVKTPFVSSNSVNTIEVISDSNNILMDASWNDPAIASIYSSDCRYTVNGNNNEILVKHTLSGITKGYAILRIELYENIPEYTELQTKSGQNYNTSDQKTVDVNVTD
nr:MAG TPA: hypothetical protein [Caudoviricetes sp.]